MPLTGGLPPPYSRRQVFCHQQVRLLRAAPSWRSDIPDCSLEKGVRVVTITKVGGNIAETAAGGRHRSNEDADIMDAVTPVNERRGMECRPCADGAGRGASQWLVLDCVALESSVSGLNSGEQSHHLTQSMNRMNINAMIGVRYEPR